MSHLQKLAVAELSLHEPRLVVPWSLLFLIPVLALCADCSSEPAGGKPPEDSAASNANETSEENVDAKDDAVDVKPESPGWFVDATEKVGLDFVHYNGTTGEYYLPEITGSGGALFDFDNDGDLDLYLVQGAVLQETDNPKAVPWKGRELPRDRLLRNDMGADGMPELRFTDVTEASGIRALGYGMGAATGDFDNDGWVDLYITNVGSNQLFRNNGDGTFTDVTMPSGTDDPRWSTSATFFDYDRDGWLDLFVTGYVAFSTDLKRQCFSASSARDYCGPDSYDAIPDRLFHNCGDGTFENVTAAAGIDTRFGAGLGVIAADFNGDGWTDIYVANDGDENQLWLNVGGNGQFKDVGVEMGAALNAMGRPEAGMGVTAADFDGDGDEDLFMTHLERESNTLYVNLSAPPDNKFGMFEDRTIDSGMHAPSLRFTSFGTQFLDYDNDGWLDLLVLNGAVRVIESLARQGDKYPLHQPNQLFRNTGQAKFLEVTSEAGAVFELSEVSRGAAFGDVDNDGDTDVVVFNNNGRARLMLNDIGNQKHWLGLRVLQEDGKRHSIGARIEIVRDGRKPLWRRVHTDGSYCSAGDPRVLIGLDDDEQPQTVRVHWPDGKSDEYNGLKVDRYWTIHRGHAPAEQGNGN